MGEMWVFSLNGVSVRKVSTNSTSVRTRDEEKQFMGTSGFTSKMHLSRPVA